MLKQNEHIVFTTEQWNSIHTRSLIPSKGSLLVEVCSDHTIKIKLGDGKLPFHKLPYVVDISSYYNKIETDEMFADIRNELRKYATIPYVDSQDTKIQVQIDALRKDSHTHSNKDILDKTNQVFDTAYKNKLDSLENYDDSAIQSRLKVVEDKAHTHSNQSILDKITAPFTTEDKKIIDSIKPDSDTGNTITEIKNDIKQLKEDSHTHSNKLILDKTTASFTKDYETKINNIETYSIFKGSTATQAGVKGLVPAPAAGQQTYYLRGDGNWAPVEGGGGGEPLTPATATTLGGVKIGNNVNVTPDGTISVDLSPIEPYVLPKATSSTLGGVKIGNNIDINDGVISVTFPTDAQTVNGHTVESDVPADAKFTDTIGVLSVTQDQSNLNELIVEYEDHSDRLVIPDTKYSEGTAIDIITGEDPSVDERRIQYIEFPSQYQNFIKLNYSPIESTNVELECEIYPNSSYYWGIFGTRYDNGRYATKSFQLGMNNSGTLLAWGRGDSLATADSPFAGFETAQSDQLVNTHLLIKTNGSTITVTNVDTGEVLIDEDHPLPFTGSNYNMNLFSIARKDVDGYSDPNAGKIYSFKIYEGTTLVRNYVPVEHNRYGIVLHEMIGNTYHAPNSSSNVHAGPYLDPTPYSNSINVLYSTGLSVNADNELINTGVLDVQESTNPLEIVKVTSDTTETVGITLPIAASDTLGGIKVGDGLSIDNTGVLSANIQENGVLDVSVNTEDPYKLDIAFSDHTKTIKLPDPLDVGVIDVRAQQDETVAVLEVEKTSGVSEIDLIALLQGLTINVNFSDDGSVINRAIINKHATERANLNGIATDVIVNEYTTEKANLNVTTTDVITNIQAVIPDES